MWLAWLRGFAVAARVRGVFYGLASATLTIQKLGMNHHPHIGIEAKSGGVIAYMFVAFSGALVGGILGFLVGLLF